MTPQEELNELKYLLREAERLSRELDDARNATPQSPRITGLPHSGTQTTLDLQMERIESAEKRFDKARERYLERLNEIEDMFDEIDDCRYHDVLYFRHIYLMKWGDVAERMHYAESTVRGFHTKALAEMARRQKNEE